MAIFAFVDPLTHLNHDPIRIDFLTLIYPDPETGKNGRNTYRTASIFKVTADTFCLEIKEIDKYFLIFNMRAGHHETLSLRDCTQMS
jgi:hypothetical protein